MKKIIKLPAPQLSQLGEVNIDLDMTGRHYAALATSKGQIPEDVALGILKDLIEEDANKLTISELRYLFMLVKIHALDDRYTVTVACTHTNKKGKLCGHNNVFEVKLSDADLNRPPHNYKVPEIDFNYEDTQKTYRVLPPCMDMESALLNYFVVERGIPMEEIDKDKDISYEFTFIRCVMHLVDKEGKRLINSIEQFADWQKWNDGNSFKTVKELYALSNQVDGFGVQKNHLYRFDCKECGGHLMFTLPLLNGLVDEE